MHDIDMSGVDPRRRPEIRRRIKAITTYLALGRKDGVERDRLAADLGLSPMTFLTLVKVWRDHGEAVRLAGAGLHRGRARKARTLPKSSLEAISDAIRTLGTSARHADIVNETFRLCEERKTLRPSSGMVQYALMKARQRNPVFNGPSGILIGRVVCKLPVTLHGNSLSPDLLLAVHSPEGKILSYALADPDSPASHLKVAIDKVVAATAMVAADAIVFAPKEIAAVIDTPTPAGIVVGPTNSHIARMLGAGIGRIGIAHRRKVAKRQPDRRGTMNIPLSMEEASEALDGEIAAHNADRGIEA
jgi:hypothetical protein